MSFIKSFIINNNSRNHWIIFSHIGKLIFSSFISNIVNLSSMFFAALLLGPVVFGIWLGAKMVMDYGGQLHLGVQHGMHREIPILRGKRDVQTQRNILDTTFTFSFIVAVIISIAVFLSTYLFDMEPEMSLALKFIAAMLFLQYINSFFGSLFRANNQFDIVTKLNFMNGIGSIFSIILLFYFSFLGFLVGQLIQQTTITTYSYWKSSYAKNWHLTPHILLSLMVVGFPIMMMALADLIIKSLDRLLILNFLGYKELGYYSVAGLAFYPLMIIFVASNSVMYPRFAERFGALRNPSALKRYITVPMEILSTGVPVLIGVIYIALPGMISIFLPEYVEGIKPAQILLFGLYFYAMPGMPGNFLVTINKQVILLGVLIGSIFVYLIASMSFMMLGWGLVGIALGASIGYFSYFLASIFLSLRYCGATVVDIFATIGRIIFPLVFVGLILAGIEIYLGIPRTFTSRGEIMIKLTSLILIFLIFTSYISYDMLKRIKTALG